jgi:CheY-like chemotaxis protein
MNALDLSESDTIAPDALSAWTTSCVVSLMGQKSISARHQATLVAQICSISVSQARRKLRGASWLFSEVLLVCRHFGVTLDAVFTPGVLQSTGWPQQSHAAAPALLPAVLWLDGQCLPCDIQLGPLCVQAPDTSLLATHHANQWCVGTGARLDQITSIGARYRVEHLQLNSPVPSQRTRIAVVDDDAGSADALTDWFNEIGYDAEAFTSAAPLLEAPAPEHDAYVVDLILAGGQTSQGLVERIRQAQPEAPIVLLTGQLRDGTASESTLATILRTQGVTFFEKPVRPAVLTAAIQSSLDRIKGQHG